jgi:threonine dehydratase
MSSLVPEAKVAAIRALGAEARITGRSQDEAALESRRLATEEGLAEIPPFDDPHVVAGQGTAGLELMEDRPDLAAVLVPLSGGGLAAGVALAVKSANPATKVIGVSMDRGAAMHAAFQAGRPVPVEEVASLADSLGGGLGDPNRLTYTLCRALLDDILLVTEAEIYRAMQAHYWQDRLVTEGAAAAPLAAVLASRFTPEGPTALILTGRNTDMETFTRVVTGQPVSLGTLTLEGRPHAP